MTTLRDWQKKASERRDASFTKFRTKEWPRKECPMCSDLSHGFGHGFTARDDDIDLLLQIIKKQGAALEFYAKDQQFNCGSPMTNSQKRDMDDYGGAARTTQAEVAKLVEKLVKDE